MMKYDFINVIKARLCSMAHRLPMWLVPRIGHIYCGYQKKQKSYKTSSDPKEWIFKRVYSIVEYAIANIPFYQKLYAERGFNLDILRSFDDIVKIPIITKQDLMAVNLEERSAKIKGRYIANTGGSTGMPLSLYKQYALKIKEMAFYHQAWKKLGYRKHKIRLQFVGRQDTNEGGMYEFYRNEIRVSIYEPFDKILHYITRYKVEFMQGYPSVLYEFALYCKSHPMEYENSGLKMNLKGIFLNSEYPIPLFRNKIEEVFGVSSMASYGHTEGCVLGFDYGDGNYHVEQTYGYAESVDKGDGLHLIGTSYDNLVSPLIRYDTNDLMDEVDVNEGILHTFKMTNGGRNGMYVEDVNGKKISLTGLMFGKHHALFNYCRHLQISQKNKGQATIYYTPLTKLPEGFNPSELFSSDGIDIKFSFKQVSEPIRTRAGKTPLLIKEQE